MIKFCSACQWVQLLRLYMNMNLWVCVLQFTNVGHRMKYQASGNLVKPLNIYKVETTSGCGKGSFERSSKPNIAKVFTRDAVGCQRMLSNACDFR